MCRQITFVICCFRILVGVCVLSAYIITNVHLVSADSLFSHDSDVVQLSATNFNSVVYDSSNLWLVNFYLTWCGHCQRFAPVYSSLATSIKGNNFTYDIVVISDEHSFCTLHTSWK